jgi:cation:H+ antiporter
VIPFPETTATWLNLLFFVLGLLIIIKGSDAFLDAAVWIARGFGVPQIIIGATVVSMCTTLPELVSSSAAALKGSGDMALGNAIGSIICNTSLILGIVLLLIQVRIKPEVFLVKGIFMFGSILIALLLVLRGPHADGMGLERYEGCVLLVLLGIFLVVNYYESIHASPPEGEAGEEPVDRRDALRGLPMQALKFALGAGAVAVGAYLLVEFGQRLARDFGVSEGVISLVFVAFGTSLPELFTAISAVRKKAQNISVGNIFGANVMNVAMVVGASGTIRPLYPKDPLLAPVDIPVALVVCGVAFISGLFKGVVGRRTGVLLLSCYVLYLLSMVLMGRLAL